MISTANLKEALQSVTTIPLIPYRQGKIDYEAHRKNVRYLMENNHLSGHRPRVVCIAGTSLIHHINNQEQNQLLAVSGSEMLDSGVLLSAIVPNPVSNIEILVREQVSLQRPPDAFLIMPLGGVYSSEGLYEGLMQLGEQLGSRYNARLLFYHRNQRDHDQVVRLIKDSDHWIGIKVGTNVDEVPSLVEEVGDSGLVIWGIGDRSTKAAQLGTTGHTSGISVVYAKAGDEINNAQLAGDYEKAYALEKRIHDLENIRFINGREFNYSAVLEAMILSGYTDIDGGEGGPFNPRVSSEVSEIVRRAIEGLDDLH
ncbi:MAG: dihydrodipicolinate synthase family protein [Saprospiraceae bacterium]|nr:dihydrodipicolinate synthase family protein [Saprospiraceae bacterium]